MSPNPTSLHILAQKKKTLQEIDREMDDSGEEEIHCNEFGPMEQSSQ